MGDFADSPHRLIADVDCTTEGKDLCEKFGVSGYPTIKYGDPADMKDYDGGRTYEDLKTFAEDNLGPPCGPAENLQYCKAEQKPVIEKYAAMSLDKLEAKVSKLKNDYEKEVPVMSKVLAYKKKTEKKEL